MRMNHTQPRQKPTTQINALSTINTNEFTITMANFTITASVATHKKVFGQFGAQLRENFTRSLAENFDDDQVLNIQGSFDTAFDAVLSQVGKSAAKPVKKAAKKVDKAAVEAKKAEKKAAVEAKKAAAEAKKAEKKAAAEAKKAEKKAAAEAKKAEKKAAAEAKKAEKEAAKKAKAAQPKPLVKRLKHDGEEFTGKNGSYLRVSVAREDGKVTKVNESNWTEEGNTAFSEVYPTGFTIIKKRSTSKPKVSPKLAKKKALAAENVEIIQFTEEQIATLKMGEMRQMIKDAKKAAKPAKKAKKAAADMPKEKKDLIVALVGEAVEGIGNLSIAVAEPVAENVELEEEDIESDNDEELEPIFPGEDEVDEFDHDTLDGEKSYYLDEDYNIWDDEETHIGTYDSENNAVILN